MKKDIKILNILSGVHTYKHISVRGKYIIAKVLVEFKKSSKVTTKYETYCLYRITDPKHLYFVYFDEKNKVECNYEWVSYDVKNSNLVNQIFKKLLNKGFYIDDAYYNGVFYRIKL